MIVFVVMAAVATSAFSQKHDVTLGTFSDMTVIPKLVSNNAGLTVKNIDFSPYEVPPPPAIHEKYPFVLLDTFGLRPDLIEDPDNNPKRPTLPHPVPPRKKK